MRTRTSTFAILALAATLAGLGLGCKRSAIDRASDATTLIRSMDKDLLEAQKAAIAKFKALPDAEDIKLTLDKGFDTWTVSEKNLSKTEDNLENNLIAKQKDAKEDALIGDLHLYTKKLAKGFHEEVPDEESRLTKTQKELTDGKFTVDGTTMTLPLNDVGKKVREAVVKVIGLDLEYKKAAEKIAEGYEPKLEALLK